MKGLRSKLILIVVLAVLIPFIYGCGKVEFSKAAAPYNPPKPKLKHKKLALVLGGGGAKGMAHIGVLEALEKAGIKPDLIVGCSAGSIIGALYASHPDAQDLKKLLLTAKKSEAIMLSIKDWPYSIYDNKHLAEYLRQNVKEHNFANLKIPLVVTATNLEFGNLTVFGEGDLIAPVLASSAAPGAFAPVKIHDQYFVDCGVADPIPVRVARDLGYETIVAVNIAEQLPDSSPNHLLGVLMRSTEIAYINQCRFAMEGADVIIDLKLKNIGMFTDEYNEYLYQHGAKYGAAAIPQIRAALEHS